MLNFYFFYLHSSKLSINVKTLFLEEIVFVYVNIHLIQNRLSSELLHCALRIVAHLGRNALWM